MFLVYLLLLLFTVASARRIDSGTSVPFTLLRRCVHSSETNLLMRLSPGSKFGRVRARALGCSGTYRCQPMMTIIGGRGECLSRFSTSGLKYSFLINSTLSPFVLCVLLLSTCRVSDRDISVSLFIQSRVIIAFGVTVCVIYSDNGARVISREFALIER